MTTPTPGKATVAATPPVSTPFSQSHLAFSPARPHPSPHPKKSPANSHTLYNHPSNTSFPLNFDSPTAAAALGALPNLGLEGLSIDAFAGAGEGQRLANVLEIISGNKGRVSEDGLENLARRVGLESLWEDQMGGNGRTLIIAGTGIALEIDFRGGIVAKVKLLFPDAPDSVTSHADAAGAVLLRDLELGEGESVLTKMLDRFAGNLERLAALDKLSVGINCYEAVGGIYESLKRLWEWEMEKLKKDEKQKNEEACKRLVMCTKSGQPEMHAHERIGLSLSYWTTQHLVSSPSIDAQTWFLLIECAQSSAFTYPIRVSSQWISPAIQKATPTAEELMANTTDTILDWLDPEQTLLSGEEKKVPEIMFIAKCEPAVIVPFHVANRILSALNLPTENYAAHTFDGLLFPPTPDEVLSANETRILKRCKRVPVRHDGTKGERKHQNELHIDKIDFGKAITSLPFSHPKELISILPWLRQYAMLSTLLQNSFGGSSTPLSSPKNPSSKKVDPFDAFMAEKSAAQAEDKSFDIAVDVTLQTSPRPSLVLNFPFKDHAATVVFDVLLGGTLHTRWENVLAHQKKRESGPLQARDLARMLEICEDIGTFVEFVRWRL